MNAFFKRSYDKPKEVYGQLVGCGPTAGVDIRKVKRLVGDKVCLCGNAHCAAMQTATDEEVIARVEYRLTHGNPGSGYTFCTSNVPFKGIPSEHYQIVLDVWKRMRNY